MSSERGYGGHVNTEQVSQPLDATRVLRLALNVLWDGLPDEMTAAGSVYDALAAIHDWINEAESAELRARGLAEHYLIIRPLSPVSPPQAMEKIATAVRTLAELGMLAGQHDALYRE
jgi:hypothetical protein